MRKLWQRLTFWLDRKPTKVKFSTRFIAYAIDWVIGGIFSGLPAVLIYAAITKRSDMFSDLYVFPSLGFPIYWSYLTGCLCLLFSMFYFVYLPYKKYPGQTPGKRFMKIKIMKLDGTDLDLKTLIIRQVVGLMLIEGVAMVSSSYLRQMLTILTGVYLEYYLTVLVSLITLISAVIVLNTPSGRSIHDYIAKTRVALEDEVYQEPLSKKAKRKKKYRKA